MSPKKTDQELYKAQLTKEDQIRKVIGSEEFDERVSSYKIQPIRRPLDEPKIPKRRIMTNTLLDKLFSTMGGMEEGKSLEFFGAFASGKTQICEVICVEATEKIVFIDAEHTFSRDRILQIAKERNKNPEDVNNRILLYQPKNWMQLTAISYQLPEFDSEGSFILVGAIIVDSLMKLFADSPDFFGRENLAIRQQYARAFYARLKDYAERHRAILVFTNQIRDKPIDTTMLTEEEKISSSGGKSIEHLGDYRVFLRKARGSIRIARLIDSHETPLEEVPFMLNEKGIDNLPNPAELVKALEGTDKYGEKFKSGQIGAQPAGEKYREEAEKLGWLTHDVEPNNEVKEGDKLVDEILHESETVSEVSDHDQGRETETGSNM